MNIRILGAHNIESKTSRCTSFVVDDVLAVDAGALTSGLSFAEQQQLKAVLLTHQHYDHIGDIPALAMNFSLHEKTIAIYSTPPVFEALSAHLLNDVLYPDFTKKPPQKPTILFKTIEAGRTETIAGYKVLPVPVNHAVPTVGYQITSPDGKKVFITSDTGPGLADVWKQTSPDLLITELTLLNKDEGFAHQSGHLTPALLKQELVSFHSVKGYLPRIVLTHINPLEEKAIKAETAVVEKMLNTKISFGYEGMRIKI
jgi:ribonuclease BN (tRNA processing enzyme)